jgi:hypothetical protein
LGLLDDELLSPVPDLSVTHDWLQWAAYSLLGTFAICSKLLMTVTNIHCLKTMWHLFENGHRRVMLHV